MCLIDNLCNRQSIIDDWLLMINLDYLWLGYLWFINYDELFIIDYLLLATYYLVFIIYYFFYLNIVIFLIIIIVLYYYFLIIDHLLVISYYEPHSHFPVRLSCFGRNSACTTQHFVTLWLRCLLDEWRSASFPFSVNDNKVNIVRYGTVDYLLRAFIICLFIIYYYL